RQSRRNSPAALETDGVSCRASTPLNRGDPMSIRQLLTDAYGRIPGIVHAAAEGLDADALAYRPDPDANSIAWLVWHLTRVQDDHVSDIAGDEQAWIVAGWHERFGMAADPHDTGYGYTSDQV